MCYNVRTVAEADAGLPAGRLQAGNIAHKRAIFRRHPLKPRRQSSKLQGAPRAWPALEHGDPVVRADQRGVSQTCRSSPNHGDAPAFGGLLSEYSSSRPVSALTRQ
jgi:hypothetical protein